MIANIVGAGIGLLAPLIAELTKGETDTTELSKRLRDERDAKIAYLVGTGKTHAAAQRTVDMGIADEIRKFKSENDAFKLPLGDMLVGAGLGALGGFGAKAVGKAAGAAKGMVNKAMAKSQTLGEKELASLGKRASQQVAEGEQEGLRRALKGMNPKPAPAPAPASPAAPRSTLDTQELESLGARAGRRQASYEAEAGVRQTMREMNAPPKRIGYKPSAQDEAQPLARIEYKPSAPKVRGKVERRGNVNVSRQDPLSEAPPVSRKDREMAEAFAGRRAVQEGTKKMQQDLSWEMQDLLDSVLR